MQGQQDPKVQRVEMDLMAAVKRVWDSREEIRERRLRELARIQGPDEVQELTEGGEEDATRADQEGDT